MMKLTLTKIGYANPVMLTGFYLKAKKTGKSGKPLSFFAFCFAWGCHHA